jgi:hypothetical protein
VPTRRGVGEIHRNLGVFDPTGGAGVLPLHPDTVAALLQITGFIHDQHRIGVTERLHHISSDVVADQIRVPLRPGQQVLQTI